MDSADVIVAGGGLIGLATAWRCAQRGLSVIVIDPAPGSGASATAAGMLAPVTELHYEGRDLLALNLESAAMYPAFAAELHDLTGIDPGYRRSGTVQAAWDAADLAALRDLHRFHGELGVASEMLTSRDLRETEPALAAGLPGGLWAADDHQVDNRRLHAALLAAAAATGRVRLVAGTVAAFVMAGQTIKFGDGTHGKRPPAGDPGTGEPGCRVTGARLADGATITAAETVLAAGAWSRLIEGVPGHPLVPVRPVKGQTLRLRAEPGLLRHIVRGSVKGNPVYIVPRDGGEVVIGASSEESGYDTTPRAGAVYELLRDAQTLVPALSEAGFAEVSTSLRPGSPDNAPLIGRGPVAGLIIATGHYRNGVLLTPVTAVAVADLVTGSAPARTAFDPQRFAPRTEVTP